MINKRELIKNMEFKNDTPEKKMLKRYKDDERFLGFKNSFNNNLVILYFQEYINGTYRNEDIIINGIIINKEDLQEVMRRTSNIFKYYRTQKHIEPRLISIKDIQQRNIFVKGFDIRKEQYGDIPVVYIDIVDYSNTLNYTKLKEKCDFIEEYFNKFFYNNDFNSDYTDTDEYRPLHFKINIYVLNDIAEEKMNGNKNSKNERLQTGAVDNYIDYKKTTMKGNSYTDFQFKVVNLKYEDYKCKDFNTLDFSIFIPY